MAKVNLDNFKYDCKLCAECCSGNMKVFLNKQDLIRMAKFLKYSSTKQLFDNNYVVIDRERSGAPLPRIKFKSKPFSFCPFLENREVKDIWLGYCILHPKKKPLVCRLAPIARTIDLDTGIEDFSFHKPFPDCPGCESSLENNIEEWILPNRDELDLETDFFRMLSSCSSMQLSNSEAIDKFYTISTYLES